MLKVPFHSISIRLAVTYNSSVLLLSPSLDFKRPVKLAYRPDKCLPNNDNNLEVAGNEAIANSRDGRDDDEPFLLTYTRAIFIYCAHLPICSFARLPVCSITHSLFIHSAPNPINPNIIYTKKGGHIKGVFILYARPFIHAYPNPYIHVHSLMHILLCVSANTESMYTIISSWSSLEKF